VYPLREGSLQSVVSDDGELIHMIMKLLKVDAVRYLRSICGALNQIEPMYDDLEAGWPSMTFQNLSCINTSKIIIFLAISGIICYT